MRKRLAKFFNKEDDLASRRTFYHSMELLVVGTVTGGSAELLVNERTGLVFQAGDPHSLASQLTKAVQDPNLVTRLRKAGRKEVEENFTIQRTITQVEAYLLNCLNVQKIGS